MWTTEYTATTPLPREAVWTALRELHSGRLTYPGADRFVLDGPFAVGSRIAVTPEGQQEMISTIVELVENERYADVTEFGGISLLFRHTLESTDDGTRVTHRLEISGDGADEVGPELGPQISGDFDSSMAALFEQAMQFTVHS
jgi:hypothetical protein